MKRTSLPGRQPRVSFAQKTVLAFARLAGWRVQIDVPIPHKCIVVGAHHTSGADFLAMLLIIFGGGVRLRWVAKSTFFRPPFAPLLRALGGVPVDRDRSSNFVTQMVELFEQVDQMRLGIAPEGTRQQGNYWRTSFYHIAMGAQAPILFGYADYRRKIAGIGGTLLPTGDIEQDFKVIQAFYANIQGRYPHKHGNVTPRPPSLA